MRFDTAISFTDLLRDAAALEEGKFTTCLAYFSMGVIVIFSPTPAFSRIRPENAWSPRWNSATYFLEALRLFRIEVFEFAGRPAPGGKSPSFS